MFRVSDFRIGRNYRYLSWFLCKTEGHLNLRLQSLYVWFVSPLLNKCSTEQRLKHFLGLFNEWKFNLHFLRRYIWIPAGVLVFILTDSFLNFPGCPGCPRVSKGVQGVQYVQGVQGVQGGPGCPGCPTKNVNKSILKIAWEYFVIYRTMFLGQYLYHIK